MTEQSEREAFEADARGAGYPLERAAGGDYADVGTRHAWNGWQSRGMWQAARASSPTYAAGWSAAVEAAVAACEELAVKFEAKADSYVVAHHRDGILEWSARWNAALNAATAIRALALPTAATDGDAVERVAEALEQAAVALGDAAARMDGWSIQGSRAASNAEDAARAALSALGIGRV